MKIRNGFVSNSSSASFVVPSFLLTEEQKEILLSLDDDKETKTKLQNMLQNPEYNFENSKNDYKKSDEYHKIYEKMEKNKEWNDSWTVGENKEDECIKGSTMMDNGCMITLMRRIGIDISAVEMESEGFVHLAQHPDAVKHFAYLIDKEMKEFKQLPEKKQKKYRMCGLAPLSFNPYELKDSQFKDKGWRLEYDNPDDHNYHCYVFIKDKTK